MTRRTATLTAWQRGAAILAAGVVVIGFASSAGAEDPPGPPACPPGLPYTMTLEQALVRYDGYYSEEFIRAAFALRDANGNGYFCYAPQPFDRFYPLVNYFGKDDLEDVGPD